MNEPAIIYQRMAVAVVKTREVDVLAVPYNTSADVFDPVHGHYRETIDPDAFNHTPRRPNSVKVLRDHQPERLIGHCRTIRPNRPDGLHATFHISNTPLGTESLELARDGALHVSVGFGANPAGDVWNDDHDAVVRHDCMLWEISLVPFPAYDGADVLAVRRAGPAADEPSAAVTSGTPNLDRIRLWALEDAYSRVSM